jgi:hypothetical protein
LAAPNQQRHVFHLIDAARLHQPLNDQLRHPLAVDGVDMENGARHPVLKPEHEPGGGKGDGEKRRERDERPRHLAPRPRDGQHGRDVDDRRRHANHQADADGEDDARGRTRRAPRIQHEGEMIRGV